MKKKRKTKEDFANQANKVHNFKYDYSLFKYINNKTKGMIGCPIHGGFKQAPNNHLKGYGCSKCSGKIKKTKEMFIEQANEVHNDKYDYSLFEYKGTHKKGIIICLYHNRFLQTPHNHLAGSGCPKCNGTIKKTKEMFIKQANEVHNDRYYYFLFEYINMKTKGIVICSKHKEFLQTPANHLAGHGCPKCGGTFRKTTKEFINQANKVHNFKYNYSLFKYTNANSKSTIICPEHGKFLQNANNHIRGNECPKCDTGISKSSQLWLDELNIPQEHREKTIKLFGKRYRIDALDRENLTAYEYNGDWWHGNPEYYNPNDIHPICKKTYGELYRKTKEKEAILKKAGFKVISIWESEQKKRM